MSRRGRIERSLWGALVADAAGVPYEFQTPDMIPAGVPDGTTIVPDQGYHRAHPGTPPGTWSDDGALLLASADSITNVGGLDERDMATRFQSWRERGYYTPDGRVFDIGNQTSRALNGWQTKTRYSARDGENTNGNGSLMRILPVALAHPYHGTPRDLVFRAMAASAVTHGHATSLHACALYCLIVAREMMVDTHPMQVVADAAVDFKSVCGLEVNEALPTLADYVHAPTGSGYVVDSLGFAIQAYTKEWSFADTVRAAIALGHDTDTTACIAGGLVAATDRGMIPPGWIQFVRAVDEPTLVAARTIGRFADAVAGPSPIVN